MDSDIKVTRITDYALAYSIVKDASIWSDIAEDGVTDFVPDVLNDVWAAVVAEDTLIGCYSFKRTSSITYETHAHIIKKYRRDWSLKASYATMQWAIDSLPCLHKLETAIPSKYVNALKHCLKIGFLVEGIRRESFTKDEQILDISLLGITKPEMREVLSWQEQQ